MTWKSKALSLLASAVVLAALALSSGADSWQLVLTTFKHH